MSSRKSPLGLGALLRLAAQAMTDELARWIAESGFEGVKPAHSAAIQPLWERPDGARITELARASRITKQSMSALVADLEAAGY
ncbi:MAG TPA: helix-turn-helix domain-containing protein, partial [Rhizomicrobium sp.]|nr:helix-turn-helix domain-containing protein [Rhizomicrobium sp.]